MTISQWQIEVDKWIKSKGVRYFDEMTNLGVLMEEVGELSRVMTRKFGEQSYKEGAQKKELADELADVFWVLTCIANQTGIDLEQALAKNMKKKNERDSDRHKNNPKLQ